MRMQRMQNTGRTTSKRGTSISFAQMSDRFICEQQAKGNTDVTIRHYRQSIRKLMLFLTYRELGESKFKALTRDEAICRGGRKSCEVFDATGIDAEFRTFLYNIEGVGDQTVSTYFRDYRVIMYFAMSDGCVKPRSIKVRSVETGVKEVYTQDEIDRLLIKPPDGCRFSEYRNWVVVNYLLATGNRVGTIVNLRISDIDFEDGMIAINIQKNKKKSRIPLEKRHLSRILLDYINKWLIGDDGKPVGEYLFPSSYIDNEKPMSRVSMGRAIAGYNLSRGVKKTSIHLFRHTFVKNWIMSGGDLHSLQKILGHSTLDMVVHYANLYEKDLSDKLNSFCALSVYGATHFSHVQRKPKRASE